jgi:hypothetical protein
MYQHQRRAITLHLIMNANALMVGVWHVRSLPSPCRR